MGSCPFAAGGSDVEVPVLRQQFCYTESQILEAFAWLRDAQSRSYCWLLGSWSAYYLFSPLRCCVLCSISTSDRFERVPPACLR